MSHIPIEKLGTISKYIREFIMVSLIAAVAYLFTLYVDMNKEIRTYLNDDRLKTVEALKENADALKENSAVLREFQTFLIRTK